MPLSELDRYRLGQLFGSIAIMVVVGLVLVALEIGVGFMVVYLSVLGLLAWGVVSGLRRRRRPLE